MSKPAPKTRPAPAKVPGIYKQDAVRDVAESLNITNLPDAVASALASDIEYRIQQVVEEAARFMRHAKRTTLTTSDIDQALRVLNIEPLYGHFPHNPPSFRRALPFPQVQSAGSVYFVEDEEIEFDRVLREEKLTMPKGVSWTAHWLAVEGVQPLIPENPPAAPREVEGDAAKQGPSAFPLTPPSADRPLQSGKQTQQQPILIKQTLSRELHLYYTRLTTSLLPSASEQSKRTAALASLRSDTGLSPLLPYLVHWVGEGIVSTLRSGSQTETDGKLLEVYLDVIGALLDNQTLGVEPFLHQLLPSVFSILLYSTLPPSHATHLRITAAQIVAHLLTHYSMTYPSLPIKVVKTLIVGLIEHKKTRATHEGAIRGLMAIGKEAVRLGLVSREGAKVVGEKCMPGESSSLVELVMAGFRMLYPPSAHPVPLNPYSEADRAVIEQLQSTLGDFFADAVQGDSVWARGILSDDAAVLL
ncbi:TAF-domain-containing protein [Epithele typhae]|uniref:TAF-domain-containing protein n=1 Tax=Epithele typhae TaxID=378194 RepID=UPI002008214D|nr:TAF-domain-containing protein [Epithele typhae]KAH9924354.1 TAF-domain-containing protein [Epithele typhae]